MARTGFSATPPNKGGNQAVVFTIDKSGYYKGARETGKALDSMQRRINSELKRSGSSGRRINVNFDIGNNTLISHKVIRVVDNVVDSAVKTFAKELAASGKQFFKDTIRTAPNRVKPQSGRIDTGFMLNSVRGSVNDKKDLMQIGIGWNLNGSGKYYRYFSFQEDGTRNGPMPMRAVPKTARFMAAKFKQGMGKAIKARMDKIR